MTPAPRKRGLGRPPPAARARKRQKRLDAIVDKPPPAPLAPSDDPDALLRRSSRVRRAPQVLDSSPVCTLPKNPPPNPRKTPTKPRTPSNSKPKPQPQTQPQPQPKKEDEMASNPEKKTPVDDGEVGDRSSRLRSRDEKGRRNSPVASKREITIVEKESSKPVTGDRERGSHSQILAYRRRRKKASKDTIVGVIGKNGEQDPILPSKDGEYGGERALEEVKVVSDSQAGGEPERTPETAGQSGEDAEEVEIMHENKQGESDHNIVAVLSPQKPENFGTDDGAESLLGDNIDGKASENGDVVKDATQSEDVVIEEIVKPPDLNNNFYKPQLKEGRRCGLCGGGMDGRPPKKLVQESTDSDHEAYEGSSPSEEPNYNPWDGFGDESGWLGRLLGPMHDRFGIARVWVHIHCAVWSPEVYFAGLGCLKNVRAALCRGRALKCSRCGRPGATIGCRVDRCPKTYHLPCSRAEGCVFDHRKFLIACNDHRHLFEPQGDSYNEHIRKIKTKKLKSDLRKISNDALRKDLEAEEKWLENCGEDEEFLKREGKRLHRDILRIAPVYIGGSCENDKLFQGWESVAGLQDVIQCMKEVVIIPLLYPEFFSNIGLTPPRGVLLHGYPGTGKTLVVRALIGACSRGDKRIAYFARKGADCLGKYVGDAERQLRLLFQVAERSQPSIIFFDEIDGLAPCRSRHQDQTHSSVVSTLLSLLDGLKSRGSVIVLGATNRPDAVDPALRRPGRFDREIYFPLPSVNDRSAIISLHTKSWPNPIRRPFLSWIANQTAGYAGADLQSLCTQAAMNALKRNCGLQELLSDAEKGSGHGRLPPLPSVVVEERDWLAALAFAPPPCSRREAGMAVNDIVSSPLHAHLIPCLLGPLVFLLISFYIDERIRLPPPLLKASKSTRRVIFSYLEQKGIPIGLWRLHLHSLIQEPYVGKEIERNLSYYGLVNQSRCYPSYVLGDNDDDEHRLDSCKAVQKFPLNSQRTLGFRALIAGTSRSGQQHLASSLLHGFMGHIEIQKVNLATISQEGRGDIIHGLTQILLKCLSVGWCIIYMPRIDLWAIRDTLGEESEDVKSSPKRIKSSANAGVHAAGKCASEAWSSFVEQLGSVCTAASVGILATSEVPNQDLPTAIRQFFTTNILNHKDSASSEHSIPRFSVQLDGNFNVDLAIKSAAEKLSEDLVQHYVQSIHHSTHMINSPDENKVSRAPGLDSGAQKELMENKQRPAALDTSVDTEQPASNVEASSKDKQSQQARDNSKSCSPLSVIRGGQEIDVQLSNLKDSFPKVLSSKVMRGSSIIATVGYQILQHAQFAELCWVTSKLEDGPCTDISGPWKGWPFNTCIMHTSSSPEKVGARISSSNLKDKGSSLTVRGLIAVGLLAYRGVYTSVREVSLEIRKVLELLVGNIRAKILCGKDRYRYLRLLSQVAYLEDMVNSWAYTYQSCPIDNQVVASTAKPVDVGRPYTDNKTSDSNPIDNCSNLLNETAKCCNNLAEISCVGSPQKSVTINCESVDFSKGRAHSALPDSDVTITPKGNQCQDPFPLAPLLPSLHLSSSTTASALISGDGLHITDGPTPSNLMESTGTNLSFDANMHISVSSDVSNKSFSRVVGNECSCLESSGKGGTILGEMNINSDIIIDKNSKLLSNGISCFYNWCSGCLHAVNELAHNILSDYWISSGCRPTVDDFHDVVTSCSLNVLAGFRKYCSSQSKAGIEAFKEQSEKFQSECCACQKIGVESADQTKEILFQLKNIRRSRFLPSKCSCHMNKEDNATAKAGMDSLCQPALKFFFENGVLMSSEPHGDAVLHCRFENLCVCTILEIILMIKYQLV